MKNKAIIGIVGLSLTSFVACSQGSTPDNYNDGEVTTQKVETKTIPPHRYGGWYCPDNLNGFPAVDIADWETVPVVNDRMATKVETQNGSSLIFVDAETYPNAKPLAMNMPQLAKFYCEQSKREEVIIVIQALNINNDSIVGFRYLNGGNGSARLNEVKIISENEIKKLDETHFVSQSIPINAEPDMIWEVMTNPENAEKLQPIFDKDRKLKADWRKTTNVNYHYSKSGAGTSSFGGELYGSYYVQNDYDQLDYTEKFILMENEETKMTELKLVCGPFGNDYEAQKTALTNWAKKVKELSEKDVRLPFSH